MLAINRKPVTDMSRARSDYQIDQREKALLRERKLRLAKREAKRREADNQISTKLNDKQNEVPQSRD